MAQLSKLFPPTGSLLDNNTKDISLRSLLQDICDKLNRKKAACSFNGAGSVVYDGTPFNCSVVRTGTGLYTVTLQNRAVVGTQYQVLATSSGYFVIVNKTNSGFDIQTFNPTGTATDVVNFDFVVGEF